MYIYCDVCMYVTQVASGTGREWLLSGGGT